MDNILIDSNFTVKITDFTVSLEIDSEVSYLRSLMGCVTIQPLEVHQNNNIVEVSSDIWALGLLIYQAVVGLDAIKFENNKNYSEIIQNSTINFEKIENKVIRNLVQQCLNIDHTKRPTIYELEQHQLFEFFKPIKEFDTIKVQQVEPKQASYQQNITNSIIDSIKFDKINKEMSHRVDKSVLSLNETYSIKMSEDFSPKIQNKYLRLNQEKIEQNPRVNSSLILKEEINESSNSSESRIRQKI